MIFGLREVPKLENLHFHFHAFSGWSTSWGPNFFWKQFLIKSYIFTNTIFFKCFFLKNGASKNEFSILCLKCDLIIIGLG